MGGRKHEHDEQRHDRPEALELLQRPARRRASYGDYVEQLTYLLFLKMADEQTQPPLSRAGVDA